MRKIAIILDSEANLGECLNGLRYLFDQKQIGEASIEGVFINNHYDKPALAHQLLRNLADQKVGVIIAVSEIGSNLAAFCDAHLRYGLKDNHILVLGVVLTDLIDDQGSEAVTLAISGDPRCRAAYHDESGQVFLNHDGFWSACRYAVYGILPKIDLPSVREIIDLSLNDAITRAAIQFSEQRAKEEGVWSWRAIFKALIKNQGFFNFLYLVFKFF